MKTVKGLILQQPMSSVFGAQRLQRQGACLFFYPKFFHAGRALGQRQCTLVEGARCARLGGSVQCGGMYRSDMIVNTKWQSEVNVALRNKCESAEREVCTGCPKSFAQFYIINNCKFQINIIV